jgi:uncharacterized membrane protein HdeD (DUF308 family)
MKIIFSMLILSIVIYILDFLFSGTPNIISSLFFGISIIFLREIFLETANGLHVSYSLTLLFKTIILTLIISGLFYGLQYQLSDSKKIKNKNIAYIAGTLSIIISL